MGNIEDSEIFNSENAIEYTKHNAIKIEDILNRIKLQAQGGMCNLKLIDYYFPPDHISVFLKLGYSISQYTDSFGAYVTKISWL